MSTPTPECNHRVYEVLIVSLVSVVAGLATGLLFTACGTSPLTAAGSGGAALAFCFTAGMSVVTYMKKER
ncbi:hypothetical protein GCM10010218_12330 [Streptomyces mashuensis]|uniref:Uncharacterized protein n=1 Tax=Streptomyces mashuensis TaxID=33904 RepID=A0A919E9Z1_9ACTN|nr:hypothetical protein [Streptomyces mashuensis]GHF32800.1 hypothetical protein GCM10010218_12330 [Streptomyces mashuensis]